MTDKKSALRSAVTEQQGKNTITSVNLYPTLSNVKSKKQLDDEYLVSTFTRFVLLGFAQNKFIELFPWFKNKNYAKCHRTSLGGGIVSLMRNPAENRAYYYNVITCANALCCPVCSTRIMGKRSAEIRTAVHQWLNTAPENTCYMLTLTFAHNVQDSLKKLLYAFKLALVAFWGNSSIKRVLTSSGRIGRITSTEIQYSQKNGFHPHQHVLIFCRQTLFDIRAFREHWLSALEVSGLTGFSEIALDLIEARSADNYLTKISSEMAMGNLKQGRGIGHYSPMQLLAEAADGEFWAVERFFELFCAVRGMHSLYWSRGLKNIFGIGECSDQEIADGVDQLELLRFLDIFANDFKTFTSSEKALLRNYAAFNDYDRAAALLVKLQARFSSNYEVKYDC